MSRNKKTFIGSLGCLGIVKETCDSEEMTLVKEILGEVIKWQKWKQFSNEQVQFHCLMKEKRKIVYMRHSKINFT